MKTLKIVQFGNKCQGVRLRGDRRNPEPETVRIAFPTGEVELTRTTDNEYWVHVRVYDNDDLLTIGEDEKISVGRITDARLDIRGRHASETNVGDFENEKLFHLAVRVANKSGL